MNPNQYFSLYLHIKSSKRLSQQNFSYNQQKKVKYIVPNKFEPRYKQKKVKNIVPNQILTQPQTEKKSNIIVSNQI